MPQTADRIAAITRNSRPRRRLHRAAVVAVIVGASLAGSGIGNPIAGATTAAKSGFHQVTVKKAGFSLLVPNAWEDLTNDSSFSSTTGKQAVFGRPSTNDVLLVILVPGVDSLPTSALRQELVQQGGKNIKIVKTKIDGRSTVQASLTLSKASAGGTGTIEVFETVYLVKGKKGLLDFTFGGTADGRTDSTVQTMVHSLKLSR